jgi:hypothetical protein
LASFLILRAPLLSRSWRGLYKQISAPSVIATLPEFAWEAKLGIWLIVKGFKPSPLTASPALAAAPG